METQLKQWKIFPMHLMHNSVLIIKIPFLLITLFLIMSFFWMSILAYWFWWLRPSVVQKNETIDRIEYTINAINWWDTITATVYLNTNKWRRKLWPSDTLSINGTILQAQYYNNGIATGYKYTQELQKSQKYTLSLIREWEKEITKVIIPHTFSVSIPDKISQKKENIISYSSEIPITRNELLIWFSSLSDKPIVTDEQWTLHNESQIYGKISNNTIILKPEDIKNLLPWNMKINISTILEQEDGKYVIASEGSIEVVNE